MECALPMFFIVVELSHVDIAIGVDFDPMAIFFIAEELPLVDFRFRVDHNAIALARVAIHLAVVDPVGILQQFLGDHLQGLLGHLRLPHGHVAAEECL